MNWEKEYDKLWERATEPNKASKLMIKDFIFSLLEEQKKELLEKIEKRQKKAIKYPMLNEKGWRLEQYNEGYDEALNQALEDIKKLLT